MIKKFYKVSYSIGTIFLILSMLMSFMPAAPTSAQSGAGAIWTTIGSCGDPQDANQYTVGDDVFIHYHNFEEGVAFTWDIVGVSGPDKNITVASGEDVITYEYANGTEGCFYAHTIQPGEDGTYKATLYPAGGNAKSDNYIVEGAVDLVLGLDVTKTADPTSMQAPGGEVTFSVTVTNLSNVTVQLTGLTDQVEGGASSSICSPPATLAANGQPGDSYSCTFVREVTSDGPYPYTETDTVTATASYEGQQLSDQASATVEIVAAPPPPTLGLDVVKTADPAIMQEPGGEVTFSVTVTNLSNVEVQFTSLTDQVEGGASSSICSPPATLAANGQPGDSYSCEFIRAVNGNPGYTETDTVTAVIAYDGQDLSAEDSATVEITEGPPPPLPSIVVTKLASPLVLDGTSGEVTYTIQVENTSEGPVTINSFADTRFDPPYGNCALVTIQPGPENTYSCSFTRTVTGDSETPHTNTMTVQAIDEYQQPAEGSDNATVTFVPLPEILVTKSANPEAAIAGDVEVTFNVVVENLSEEDLTLDSLTDTVFGDLNGAADSDCATGGVISAGGSYTCSFVRTITGAADEIHTNVVTAVTSDSDDNQAEDSDFARVVFTEAPEVTLEDPCAAGCDSPNVEANLCYSDPDNAYTETINWTAYDNGVEIGSGTVNNIPAGGCVILSAPRIGEGPFSVVAELPDETTLESNCGPLVCSVDPTPTPIPPVNPPETETTGPFIPVTGMELGAGNLISSFQNIGLALLSLGLVLHGFSLQENRKKKNS